MSHDDTPTPSRGFAKLDAGIVDSTLWMKPHDALRVWIAMLAKCDSYGVVRAAAPAMAHLCMVPLERFEEIIEEMCSPDNYSRTQENGGRRLQKIEGGWVVLNYIRYRDLMQRKAMSHAERQKRYRDRVKERDESVTLRVTRDTEAEAEAEAEEKKQAEPPAPLPAEKPSRKKKATPFDPKTVPIPLLLNTPEFTVAWFDFCDYRKKIGKPFRTEHGPADAFSHLSKLSPEQAAEAIRITRGKEWIGVEHGVAELAKRRPETAPRANAAQTSAAQERLRVETAAQALVTKAYAAWQDGRLTEDQRDEIVAKAEAAKTMADLEAIAWPT